MHKDILEIPYFNKVIDKFQLKYLITWAFRHYGIARASNMVDKLKDLGFYYATKAGISLSLEDLRIPPSKQNLLDITFHDIADTENRYKRGEITAVERFQKVIDTWNYASENLKHQVVTYFKETDPLNSIYMMAFSGARANISQVRQLVGMRGLMADPQGQIIDLPIANNFREGLNVTDYFISSYGARKGLVDTALRTADSGYLTRRLVDVAQDVIVREYDCKTSKGILISAMINNQAILISLKQALLGRVLAEDMWDINTKTLIAQSGQSLDPILIDKCISMNLDNILVRSPLTCSSIRSVCQLCYGWNLAHGKMVDLGEAIGIIAAQSIGEPGTQLTMRTFHTGGVFTGELEKNLCCPASGYIKYPSNVLISQTRTKHGDYAMLVHNDCALRIVDSIQQINDIINISKGSLLLVEDNARVKQGQIIAQCPLNSRLTKERAQKTILADFSGSVHIDQQSLVIKHDQDQFLNSLHSNTIVWLLSGQVYDIPNDTQLMVADQKVVNQGSLIARTELISHYSGLIHVITSSNHTVLPKKILLITSSKAFSNCKIWIEHTTEAKSYILEIDHKDKFLLKNNFNKRICNNQIIADLVSNAYKTKTGGIIKYLDIYSVKSHFKDNDKEIYDIQGAGYILWIAEETHVINKDLSSLFVFHGQIIDIGTEIIQNVFANNSGVLEIIEKDGIVREIIIKPGCLYELNDCNCTNPEHYINKLRGFLRPGEQLINDIIVDKLAYWEYMKIQDRDYILVRPVIIYAVPSKNICVNVTEDSFEIDMVNVKLIRRTQFRDGERVKSVAGVNLITTHLIVELSDQVNDLKCSMQLEKDKSNNSYFYLKFIIADLLFIKDPYFVHNQDLYTETHILAKDKEYIKSGSVIAQTNIFSAIKGRIDYIQNKTTVNRRILMIGESNTLNFDIDNNQAILVKVNDWVYAGDYIATATQTQESGKVLAIQDNQIIIRIGQPYLISAGSFLHIVNQSLVQRGENIATLIYDRSKTGDIVQGLPRIEEILEARKKTDTCFNPHFILDAKFKYYSKQGLSLYDATRQSFLDIQLFLVKEVQLVYQSQGVDIADKHIEVIVRQMTSKVKIQNGGDTNYLPGEIVDLKKVEAINKSLALIQKAQALYYPILLGITKASLNTESFISAASFQETTKVLTDAAISGKLDWLRGLKENVIIGRLIPAGTGFNAYQHKVVESGNSYITDNLLVDKVARLNHHDKFDDIIIDDRNIGSY